jgi:hypothetical protein
MQRFGTLIRLLVVIAVVSAGTAVVGRAASITLSGSGAKLGAEEVTLSTCPVGSVKLTVTKNGGGTTLTRIKPTLDTTSPACPGAVDTASLYAWVDNTTTGTNSGNSTACTLTGAPPYCTVRLATAVAYVAADSYKIDILARPGAAGTSGTSANHLTLASQYLTLRTCTATGTTLSAGTTC